MQLNQLMHYALWNFREIHLTYRAWTCIVDSMWSESHLQKTFIKSLSVPAEFEQILYLSHPMTRRHNIFNENILFPILPPSGLFSNPLTWAIIINLFRFLVLMPEYLQIFYMWLESGEVVQINDHHHSVRCSFTIFSLTLICRQTDRHKGSRNVKMFFPEHSTFF